MLKKYLLNLILSLFILTFLSCGNSYQTLESSYKRGDYLKAAQIAVENLKNADLKPQITAFLISNRETLFNKAIIKGQNLLVVVSDDNGIQYFTALNKVLNEMISQDLKIPSLNYYQEQAQSSLNEATEKYLSYHYQNAQTAFSQKLYRQTIVNLEKVKKYAQSFQNTDQLLSESIEKAQRTLVLVPFYKPLDIYTQYDNTIANTLTPRSIGGSLSEKIVIDGLDVTEAFNTQLMYELNRRKSRFYTVKTNDHFDFQNSDYFLNGIIDIKTEQENNIDMDNSEPRLIVNFTATVLCKAGLFSSPNNREIKTFAFNTQSAGRFTFSGTLEQYFPKTSIIQEAVSNATGKLAGLVLEATDKDLLP